MSYRGLGQAKIVPGQINFSTLPAGRTSFSSLEPLVRAGLPIAPYIEHGSWETGEPSIMRYGLDPYRGIMGLGCFFGRTVAPSTSAPGGAPASFAAAMSAARSAGGGSSIPASIVGRGTVECNGTTVYSGDALTAMTFGVSHARQNRIPCVVRMTGTPQGDTTMYVSAEGRPSRRAPTGASGLGRRALGQGGGAAEPQVTRFEVVVAGEPRGQHLFEELLEAADAAAMLHGRSGKQSRVVSPPGSENVVADVDTMGRVRMLHGLGRRPALGQALTDLMCSDTAVASSWRSRVTGGLNAGAQAALLSAAAAGFIGALLGKPVLGAAAGAAIGWSGYSIWTATYRT